MQRDPQWLQSNEGPHPNVAAHLVVPQRNKPCLDATGAPHRAGAPFAVGLRRLAPHQAGVFFLQWDCWGPNLMRSGVSFCSAISGAHTAFLWGPPLLWRHFDPHSIG